VGWHIDTVRLIQRDFTACGVAAFQDERTAGRLHQLMPEDEERSFLDGFLAAAADASVPTAGEMKAAPGTKVGRLVHKTTVYQMLRRHGWRKAVPRPRHPRQDAEAQEAFKSELYLFKHQREGFKKDITDIKDLFFERILPAFAYPEHEAEEYKKVLWNSLMKQSFDSDEPDPSDCVDYVQEEAINKYQLLLLMRYRTISMWIACMCQVWEQQLFYFVIEYVVSDKNKGFQFAKFVFEYYNQPFEKMKCWAKINELRLLVNVIKHAEGKSEKKLRTIRPDLFTHNASCGLDLLKLYHSTLLEETIQIDEKDFIEYHNALVAFWDELPERMISTFEI